MGVIVFYKQKTAYEVRISDWSSDVCSSDLYRLQRPNLLLTLKVACGTVEMKNTALIKRKSIVCSYVDTLDLLPCGILQIVGNNRTNSPRPNIAAAKIVNDWHVR